MHVLSQESEQSCICVIGVSILPLVATSADSVPSSYLVRITIAPIGTTFGNLQGRRYLNNFTFEYSSNNNIFSFVAMSADSYLHQRPIFFKTNSSIVAILELFRGAQCLIEVIRSSGEEMWRVDAYQIPYYSRGIEGAKRTHPRIADYRFCLCIYHFSIALVELFRPCGIY